MSGSPAITDGTELRMFGLPADGNCPRVNMHTGLRIAGSSGMVDGGWWKDIGASSNVPAWERAIQSLQSVTQRPSGMRGAMGAMDGICYDRHR